ncbi:MAG: hypothetical protein AAFZ74_00790 [Pseudomonadota bacterium]
MGLFRLSMVALVTALSVQSTYAGTRHQVRFAQSETVMVWQDGQAISSGAQVFITAPDHRAMAPLFGSGALEPVMAPSSKNVQSTILELASNSGFILVVDGPATGTIAQVAVLGVGEHAQLNTRAGNEPGPILFEQVGKTAARPGNARSQAIKLEVRWTGDIAPSLIVRTTRT